MLLDPKIVVQKCLGAYHVLWKGWGAQGHQGCPFLVRVRGMWTGSIVLPASYLGG